MYGCCGLANRSWTSAVSTTRPAYMTATRSARSATTPRSWVIKHDAGAESFAQVPQYVEDAGLDRDVECGGRLVGDQDLRVAGDGHRDHHALAHTAGELVRIVVDATFGGRDADELEQFDRRGRARPGGTADRAIRSTSPIWWPTVKTGFSDVIGSWKMYAISRPRIDRSVRLSAPISSTPSQLDRAVDGRGAGEQAGQAHRGHTLAAAGLADDREYLAVADLEARR